MRLRLAGAVLLSAAAYYVYLPLPSGVSEPWKLMLLDALFRSFMQAVSLQSDAGDGRTAAVDRLMRGDTELSGFESTHCNQLIVSAACSRTSTYSLWKKQEKDRVLDICVNIESTVHNYIKQTQEYNRVKTGNHRYLLYYVTMFDHSPVYCNFYLKFEIYCAMNILQNTILNIIIPFSL